MMVYDRTRSKPRNDDGAMQTLTLEHAKRLWTYMSASRANGPSDAIVVCCSYDLRVCDYACRLVAKGVAARMVVTGKTGNWTRHLWDVPEAHVFRRRALVNGIEPKAIFVEDQAANFGENVTFVRKLLPELKRITFVTKPNSVLRVALTVAAQWPGIEAHVDAPPIGFPEEISNLIGLFGVINEMVGDIERILRYPATGYQVSHGLPEDVLESWRYLVSQGFTHHMLTDNFADLRK